MTYGSETWAARKDTLERLSVAQRRMERIMLGVTLLDHKTTQWLRSRTQVVDVLNEAIKRKWGWAARVADMTDEKWPKGDGIKPGPGPGPGPGYKTRP